MFVLLKESAIQAMRALRSNRLRSMLTMLGIIIGVGSVVVMLTVGRGVERLILDEFESFGSNLFYTLAGGENTNIAASASIKSLTNKDLEALSKDGALLHVSGLSPITRVARLQVQESNNEETGVSVWGTDRSYFFLQNVELEEGRVWTSAEEKANKKVAVLGGSVDEQIFGENHGSLLGKRLTLKGQTYTIIGVIKEQEGVLSSLGNENNEYVFVPTEVAQKLLVDTPDYVWGIIFKARDDESMELAKQEVAKLLRKEHDIAPGDDDDFTIVGQDQFVEIFGTVAAVFTLFLSALAGISLFVGGVGIMNIMLVVVSERISEIGIRKALGARRKDILIQFLVEALILTSIGGAIGVVAGLLLSLLLAIIGGWTFILSIEAIILGLGGAALFGVVFGLWPAVEASKLDPILAIKH